MDMFEPAPGLEAAVSKHPAVTAASLEAAEKIADIARSTAPVGESEAYRNGIQVEQYQGGARVHATDFTSAWIEFGVPAHGIPARFNLRNAVRTAGYGFRKSHG